MLWMEEDLQIVMEYSGDKRLITLSYAVNGRKLTNCNGILRWYKRKSFSEDETDGEMMVALR